MKTIAYIPLHYGLEYLETTIKSLDPVVEKILCIYTGDPSYGHGQPGRCPEPENLLRELAFDTSGKIMWHRINAGLGTEKVSRENAHRGIAFRFSGGYDVLLTLDTDEVWEPSQIDQAIKDTFDYGSRNNGINGFVNFFRSFDYIVRDGFQPVRTHNLRSKDNTQKTINSTIYHFGYCQSEKIMRYKWTIHGHQNELQRGYLDNKFYKWTGPGCGVNLLHPVSMQIWQDAEPFDKNTLPDILKNHPNFDKKLI